jgi:hypothetical protein
VRKKRIVVFEDRAVSGPEGINVLWWEKGRFSGRILLGFVMDVDVWAEEFMKLKTTRYPRFAKTKNSN